MLGSIMSELKALGIFDDTLLVFLHDHGTTITLYLEHVDERASARESERVSKREREREREKARVAVRGVRVRRPPLK